MRAREAPIGNIELIAAVNSRLVLHAVRILQPTYRAEVARKTRLKPATVTGIVSELLEQELLRETQVAQESCPRGGRPPQMLRINGDARRILAIDLEPDVIRVALTNLLVEELAYRERLIDRFAEPAVVCSQMLELCRELLATVEKPRLLGVGLSLPGLIDRNRGLLLSSTNMPRWRDVPIRGILERELGMPVRMNRSLHLAALYEKWIDSQLESRDCLVISLRTGIGMTLMHRGDIYTGSQGFAGEIGHTVVDLNGRPCECGSRGCLETFVSASAICERAQALMSQGRGAALAKELARGEVLRPALIYRLAKEGDPDCADIVRDVGRYIGIAASNMINLFAPQDVILCGSIDTADELILQSVQTEIARMALPKMREIVSVRLASAKEKSPLLGAAALVAQELFELPRLSHSVLSA